jgi:hypothetical protein
MELRNPPTRGVVQVRCRFEGIEDARSGSRLTKPKKFGMIELGRRSSIKLYKEGVMIVKHSYKLSESEQVVWEVDGNVEELYDRVTLHYSQAEIVEAVLNQLNITQPFKSLSADRVEPHLTALFGDEVGVKVEVRDKRAEREKAKILKDLTPDQILIAIEFMKTHGR